MVTYLAEAATAAQKAAIEAPAIIAIGEIVRLLSDLNWLCWPGPVEQGVAQPARNPSTRYHPPAASLSFFPL